MTKYYNIVDLENLNKLFKELYSILLNEGDSETNYAKGTLANMIKVITDILNSPDSINLKEVFDEIIERYKGLYPPRGGLTEFFIWRDNFDDRVKANKPLNDIKEAIKSIIGV
ncbi:MAG TPA: hypothetical protein VF941_08560 [Clostridia bacterium]